MSSFLLFMEKRSKVFQECAMLGPQRFLVCIPVLHGLETIAFAKLKHFFGILATILLLRPCGLVAEAQLLEPVDLMLLIEEVPVVDVWVVRSHLPLERVHVVVAFVQLIGIEPVLMRSS